MKLGMFMMPFHDESRELHDTYEEDIYKSVLADKLGFEEVWIGQHLTCSYEPIASPLMFLSALVAQTTQIKLCTGVINLPCHNPATVASEVAQLDNMAKGRFIFGIGPGSLTTDFELFGVLEAREERMLESIRLIKELWTSEAPYDLKGKYWNIKVKDNFSKQFGFGPMLKPFQKPYPPIGVAMMSPFSGTAKRAAVEGWLPISANFISGYCVASHWKKYLEGCEAAGRTPDGRVWRVSRSITVARTDEEARELVFGQDSNHRKFYDYHWEILKALNYSQIVKPDPKMPDDEVTSDMRLEELVIYGSPKTVAEKVIEFRNKVGPFGTLVMAASDWTNHRDAEEESMRLLATEVQPLLTKALARQ
jgi:alkanesulfonate monooxygenase SsuD/methylene tetrahydromethanopterin reductase-like flavin-dependent oxidoreductase (luciferase family)